MTTSPGHLSPHGRTAPLRWPSATAGATSRRGDPLPTRYVNGTRCPCRDWLRHRQCPWYGSWPSSAPTPEPRDSVDVLFRVREGFLFGNDQQWWAVESLLRQRMCRSHPRPQPRPPRRSIAARSTPRHVDAVGRIRAAGDPGARRVPVALGGDPRAAPSGLRRPAMVAVNEPRLPARSAQETSPVAVGESPGESNAYRFPAVSDNAPMTVPCDLNPELPDNT